MPLEPPRGINGCKLVWKTSEPFVLNDRAVLVHRPKCVASYQSGKRRAHIAVSLYCGNTFTGLENLSFTSDPTEHGLVCAICEEKATQKGLPSSDEIAGKHVCKGRLKAINTCCGNSSEEHF